MDFEYFKNDIIDTIKQVAEEEGIPFEEITEDYITGDIRKICFIGARNVMATRTLEERRAILKEMMEKGTVLSLYLETLIRANLDVIMNILHPVEEEKKEEIVEEEEVKEEEKVIEEVEEPVEEEKKASKKKTTK